VFKTILKSLFVSGIIAALFLSNAQASYLQNGVLYILGTDGSDSIQLSEDGDRWKIQASYDDGASEEEVWFDKSDVVSVQVKVCSGGDQVQMGSLDIPSLIFGDDGKDQIQGGDGPDTIYGGAGDDQIEGNDGDDILFGGGGNDDLQGGNGNNSETQAGPNGSDVGGCTFNTAPVFVSMPSAQAPVDQLYSYIVVAEDIDGDNLTYTLAIHPSGMTINATNGAISWTPTSSQVGDHEVVINVSDGRSGSASQSFTAIVTDVNLAPTINSLPVTEIAEGEIYQYSVLASDSDGDVLAYSLVNAPTSMTISETGIINWLVSYEDEGLYSVGVEVSDGKGGSDRQDFDLSVTGTNRDPQIDSLPILTATEGLFYEYAIVASDDDGDTITYELLTAPVGMTINSQGLVQWEPDYQSEGVHPIEIAISDSAGAVSSQSFELVVANTNRLPQINSLPFTAAVVAFEYRYQINASDSDGDELFFSLNGIVPQGVSIDDSGLITWTPVVDQVAVHPISVTVSDGTDDVLHEFDLRVVAAPATVPSNLGRDFWLLDPEYAENPLVFIASTVATSGVLEVHTIQKPHRESYFPFTVAAGEVIAIDVSYSQNAVQNDRVLQRSIHVTTEDNVSVFNFPHSPSNSNMDLVLPTSALGTDHIVMSYQDTADIRTVSQLQLIATEDNTTVNITPADDVIMDDNLYHDRGEMITRVMNRGDHYSLRYFRRDSTGTEVTSDKPIAVYGGVNIGQVPIDESAADMLLDQSPPIELWGRSYITAPLLTRHGDFFRVLAAYDNTVIHQNGVAITTLNRGQHYEFQSNVASHFTGTKPFLLAQYATSDRYDDELRLQEPSANIFNKNNYSQHFLKHLDTFQTSYTITIEPAPALNYVVVLMPEEFVDELLIDGEPAPEGAFVGNLSTGNNYQFAQIALPPGQHTLTAPVPFGVYENMLGLTYYADPFMAIAASTQQYLDNYVFAVPKGLIARNFITINIEHDSIGSVNLDGVAIDPAYFTPIAGSNYSFARLAINPGTHQLTADKPFGLFLYGFDRYSSYGSKAGFSVPSTEGISSFGLSMNHSSLAVGEEFCLTVQALGQAGEPLAASALLITVDGIHNASSELMTDKNGLASHCYIGYRQRSQLLQ